MGRPLLTVTSDIVITFGTNILAGPFDSTMVDIAWDQDNAEYEPGAAGVGSVIVQPNLGATITVNVHQGSPDIPIAEKALLAWRTVGVALPLSIKNTRDGTIHVAEAAWVQNVPPRSYSTTLVVVPIVFRTAELIPETQDGATV